NWCQAPAFNNSAQRALRLERQLINAAQNESMTRIEIRTRPLRVQIPEILGLGVGTSHRIVVDRLRPRVGRGEREPLRKPAIDAEPEAVVVRIRGGHIQIDARET